MTQDGQFEFLLAKRNVFIQYFTCVHLAYDVLISGKLDMIGGIEKRFEGKVSNS